MAQPDFRRIVRKNPESYREYGAEIFAGEAAKDGQDKNFIEKHQPPRWLVFFRGFRDPAEFEPDRPKKKPEEYREYAAGFFAGEAAKGGQGVEII